MYNFRERRGLEPYFDFIGPAVGLGRSEPEIGLVVPRTPSDYTPENIHLLPPNTLRTLVSEEAIGNLNSGFRNVDMKHPGRFKYFDLHMRGLFDRESRNLILPWDVLTYTIFDGIPCYAPVNVSFSHVVMNSKWDMDPQIDFEIKREIIERQIYDVTTYNSIPGLEIELYAVSFPLRFAQGNTDRIFMDYPSDDFVGKNEKLKRSMKCRKKVIDLGDGYGEYAIYFFGGRKINQDKLARIADDPAFVFYCEEISRRWNGNFSKLIKEAPETPEFYDLTMYRLLTCLGASPKPPENMKNFAVDCN